MRLSELLNRKVVTESGDHPRARPRRARRARRRALADYRARGRPARRARALRRRHAWKRRAAPRRRCTVITSSRGSGSCASAPRSSSATERRPSCGDGLRGARRPLRHAATPKAELFLRHADYGEPDVEIEMDYYFWLLRDGGAHDPRRLRVRARGRPRRGRTLLVDPVDALRALGVDAGAVSTVVVTHVHYDHIGNLQRSRPRRSSCRAASSSSGPARWPARFQFAAIVEPAELDRRAAAAAGRVRMTDGQREILHRASTRSRSAATRRASWSRRRGAGGEACWPRTRCTSTRSSRATARSPWSTTSRRCTRPTTCCVGWSEAGQRARRGPRRRTSAGASRGRALGAGDAVRIG